MKSPSPTNNAMDMDVDNSNMQRQYGSTQQQQQQQQDEESSSGSGASVEMIESQSAIIEGECAADGIATKSLSLSSPLLMSAVAPVSSLLQAIAALYSQQLTLHPWVTKSLTTGIIFGLSDWCAQLIELRETSSSSQGLIQSSIVFSRILTTFLVGLLYFGPAATAWYSLLIHAIPSTSLLSTLQKTALGQLIFGPTYTCIFFAAGLVQSNSGEFSLEAWWSKIQTDLPGVWMNGVGFWSGVDIISYKFVPLRWIPLFVNFGSFVWTIYLSLVSNRESKGVEE